MRIRSYFVTLGVSYLQRKVSSSCSSGYAYPAVLGSSSSTGGDTITFESGIYDGSQYIYVVGSVSSGTLAANANAYGLAIKYDEVNQDIVLAKYYDMPSSPAPQEDLQTFKGIGLDPSGAYLLYSSEKDFTMGALKVSDLSVHRVVARQKTNSEHDFYEHYNAPNTVHFYNNQFMGSFDYEDGDSYGCIFYVNTANSSGDELSTYTKNTEKWNYCLDYKKPIHCPLTYYHTDNYMFVICYMKNDDQVLENKVYLGTNKIDTNGYNKKTNQDGANLNFSNIVGTEIASSNNPDFRLSYCGEIASTELMYFTSALDNLNTDNSPTSKFFKFTPSSTSQLKCMTIGHSSDIKTIYTGVVQKTGSGTSDWIFMIMSIDPSNGDYTYQTVTNAGIKGILPNNIRAGGSYGSDGFHRFVGTTNFANGASISTSQGFIMSFDNSKNFAGQSDTTYSTSVSGTMSSSNAFTSNSEKPFSDVGISYEILRYTDNISSYTLNGLTSLYTVTQTVTPSSPPSSLSPYTVTASKMDISITAFTVSPSSCSLTYSLTVDGNAAPYKGISFNSSTMKVEIYTTDCTNAGTYSLVLSATTGSTSSSMTAFDVTISSCITTTLDKPSSGNVIADQTYTIGQGAKTVTFDDYAPSENTYSMGTLTYSATSANFGALSSSCISIPDSTKLEFQINCVDNSFATTDTITITASESNGLSNNAESFTISYTAQDFDLIAPSDITSFFYVVGQSTKEEMQFGVYTISNSYAGATNIQYSAKTTGSALTGSFTDQTLTSTAFNGITFDSANREFSVSTTDTQTEGTYTVTIVAEETNNIGINQADTFTIKIYSEILEPVSSLTDKSYNVQLASDPATDISIPAFQYNSDETWTQGTISFSVKVDGNTLPYNGISFTGSTLTVLIIDNQYVGSYTVEIIATEDNYDSTTTESFTLSVNQLTPAIDTDQLFSQQTYILTQTALEIDFNPFQTSNYDGSVTISYDLDWQSNPGYTLASVGITLDTANTKIVVYSTDSNDVGTHPVTFAVTASYQLGSTPTQTTQQHNFDIIISEITVTAPGNFPTSETATVQTSGTVNLAIDLFDCSPASQCVQADLTYEAYEETQSTLPSFFSPLASTSDPDLKFQPVNNADAGSYSICVKATQASSGAFKETCFDLTVSPFTVVLMQDSDLASDINYMINEPQTSQTFDYHTIGGSPAYQGTYSLTYTIDSGSSSSLFGSEITFADSSVNEEISLTWESADLSHDGSHSIIIEVTPSDGGWTGSIEAVTKQLVFHTIQFTAPTGNTVSALTQTYNVQDGSVTTSSFDPYTISSTHPSFLASDYTITYSAKLRGGSSLPSGVTFDQSSRSFTIDISENSLAGSYIIDITAETSPLGYTDNSQFFSLTVNEFDPITLSSNGGFSDIGTAFGGSMVSLTFNEFTSDYLGTLAISYTASIQSGETLAALDASFDSSTRTFSIQTSNSAIVGSYTVLITGSGTAGTVNTQLTEQFDLEIVEVVLNLHVDDLLDYTVQETRTLDVTSGIVSGSTGNLSYETYQHGQTTLPSFITFDSKSLQYTVETNENSLAGTYDIDIKVTEDEYNMSETHTFQIVIAQFEPMTLTNGLNWRNQEYTFQSGEVFTYTFDLPQMDYLGTVTYSYSLASTIPTDFLVYDGQRTFSIPDLSLLLEEHIGSYPISVDISVSDFDGPAQVITHTFTLTILEQTDNYAPEWSGSIADQEVYIGESLLVILPGFFDLNTEDTFTFSLEEDSVLSGFTTFDQNALTISFEPSEGAEQGSFELTVIIQDNDSSGSGEVQTDTLTFTLTISQIQAEDQEEDLFTPETPEEIFGVNIEDFQAIKSIEPQALLSRIDETARATITFDQAMLVPQNLTLITPQMLQFSLRSEYDHYDTSQMIENWQVIDFSGNSMRIQFNFDQEEFISSNQELDNMEMEFIDSTYFISEESLLPMPMFTILKANVDQQVSEEEKAEIIDLEKNAKWLSEFLKWFFMFTFLMSLIFGMSLQSLWSMVNTMQIIIHTPLINMNMPKNALILITALQDMASFAFFSVENGSQKLLGLNDLIDAPPRYQDLGMDTTNFILNSGTLVYMIALWTLATGVTSLIGRLIKKETKIDVINQKIREVLIYGFIIVTLLEGYLELYVCSLLHVQNLQWGSFGKVLSSFCAIGFAIVFTVMPFFVVGFLQKLVRGQISISFLKKTAPLYQDLKPDRHSQNYYSYFLYRRAIYALSLGFLGSSLMLLQVNFFTLTSVSIFIYTYLCRPFALEATNTLELFNEAIVLLLGYQMYGFTDYQLFPSGKKETGWSYCYMIGFCIAINVLVVLYQTLKGPFGKLWQMVRKGKGVNRKCRSRPQQFEAVQTTQMKLQEYQEFSQLKSQESPEQSEVPSRKKEKKKAMKQLNEINEALGVKQSKKPPTRRLKMKTATGSEIEVQKKKKWGSKRSKEVNLAGSQTLHTQQSEGFSQQQRRQDMEEEGVGEYGQRINY